MASRIMWPAIAAIAVAAAATGTVAAQETASDKAAAVIAAAREALGGEQKLSSLKGLSLRASYQRELTGPAAPLAGGGNVMIMGHGSPVSGGSSQVTGDIEIDVQLPDKYIKVDTSSGPFAMTRTEGFEGERPFADVSSSAPGMRIMMPKPGDSAVMAEAILRRNRADLARLLLGAVAGTQPGFPVTFSYVAQAESPDGRADVLDVNGPDEFKVRLFIDSETHLPLMLTYMAPEPRIVVRTMTKEQSAPPPPEVLKDHPQEPATLIEYRVFFSDYREVGGIRLPHRITRGTAAATTEEWEVTTFKVNPQLKADRFKVS